MVDVDVDAISKYNDRSGSWGARRAPAGGEAQVHSGHLRPVVHFYGGNRHPRLHHEGLGATAVRRRPWCRWCCTRLATWPPIFVVLYLLVPQKTKSSLLVILCFHGGDRHPRLRTYTIEGVTLSRAYIVPRDGALQGNIVFACKYAWNLPSFRQERPQ